MQVPSLLLLGFSVVADRGGFADMVAHRYAGTFEFERVGLGGTPPPPLPGILRDLIRAKSRDWVFLEIATSTYSTQTADNPGAALDVLYDLVRVIHDSGAKVGFINLFRQEWDYAYLPLDMLIESMAYRYGLPLLDLANRLEQTKGRAFCMSVLRDNVHHTREGAEWLADQVDAFIRGSIEIDAPQRPVPRPHHRRVRRVAERFVSGATTGRHHRAGFEASYVELPADAWVKIELPEPKTIYGVSYVTHPRAGRVEVRFGPDDGPIVEWDVFYEFSYYEHYRYQGLRDPQTVDRISFRQRPEIPQVPLKKGTPSAESRIGKLLDLYCY